MGTVLMTNPPGLTLAVIGNPARCSTSRSPKGTSMPKRSTKRRAARATAAARQATAAPAPRQRRASRSVRRAPVPAAAAAPPTRAAPAAKRNPSRRYWRVSQQIPWKNPGAAAATAATAPSAAGRSRRRRSSGGNDGADSGLAGDVTGLGSALADIRRQPMGLAWVAGGAAATAVGGNLVAAQVAQFLPNGGAGVGRVVHAAVFAGVALGASRLLRHPTAPAARLSPVASSSPRSNC